MRRWRERTGNSVVGAGGEGRERASEEGQKPSSSGQKKRGCKEKRGRQWRARTDGESSQPGVCAMKDVVVFVMVELSYRHCIRGVDDSFSVVDEGVNGCGGAVGDDAVMGSLWVVKLDRRGAQTWWKKDSHGSLPKRSVRVPVLNKVSEDGKCGKDGAAPEAGRRT